MTAYPTETDAVSHLVSSRLLTHSSYPLLSSSAIHLHDLLEFFPAISIRRVVSLGVVVYRACNRNRG